VSGRVADKPSASRYELPVDGDVVGTISYVRDGDVVDMQHTVVDPHLQEQGLGSELVAAALADARDRGLEVKPTCGFVAAYIREHPEYADLVAR
jgi:predicted GNAT family acetyltransferase